jgi:hypothetical protein
MALLKTANGFFLGAGWKKDSQIIADDSHFG